MKWYHWIPRFPHVCLKLIPNSPNMIYISSICFVILISRNLFEIYGKNVIPMIFVSERAWLGGGSYEDKSFGVIAIYASKLVHVNAVDPLDRIEITCVGVAQLLNAKSEISHIYIPIPIPFLLNISPKLNGHHILLFHNCPYHLSPFFFSGPPHPFLFLNSTIENFSDDNNN